MANVIIRRAWFPIIWPVVLALVVIGIIMRVVADGWDRERITEYMLSHHGTVEDITWQPLAFWWQKNSDRAYLVTYRSAEGLAKQVHCRTSLFGGVYLSEE